MSITKKQLPEKDFETFLANITSGVNFYTSSYIENEFDVPIFNKYFLSKEQLEIVFRLYDENVKNIISPCSHFRNNGHWEYDITDNIFQSVNFLCGVLRDAINNKIITDDEAFEGTKFILKWFINIHKFILLENYYYYINDKKRPFDFSWKETYIYSDSWYSDRYYKGLPIWLTSFRTIDKKYIDSFEEIIEKNIKLFSVYDFAYNNGFHSPLYLIETFQEIFPFSVEFIERNYMYFDARNALKNIHIMNSKPHLDIIFGKVVQNNLDNIVEIYSRGSGLPKIKLTKEQIDEYILLFVTK